MPLYYNRLPHLTAAHATYFVTFCTHDSIPVHALINDLKDESLDYVQKFKILDLMHDLNAKGINLVACGVADIIYDQLMKYHRDLIHIYTFCIMPNHVHMLFEIKASKTLGQVMQLIKGNTSRSINQLLQKSGTFWQKASYDRLVRNEKEMQRIFYYIINNPVKAKLIENWENWKYTFIVASTSVDGIIN